MIKCVECGRDSGFIYKGDSLCQNCYGEKIKKDNKDKINYDELT